MKLSLIRLLDLAGLPAHLVTAALSGQAFARPRFADYAAPLEPPSVSWRIR